MTVDQAKANDQRLAHFGQKCNRGFVPENAQIQTIRASSPAKSGSDFADDALARFVTRFAPSPTGLLHLGNAFSALTAFDAARAAKGSFLLRIEDLDMGRCRPHYEAAILEDLAWLGLTWDEAPLRQSERAHVYGAVLESLRNRGLLYRCFKTRKEIAAAITSAPHQAGTPFRGEALPRALESRLLAEGAPFAWRLSLARCREELKNAYEDLRFFEAGQGPQGQKGWIAAQPERVGDEILARKDIGFSYHLASCCDDAHSGITHVIRGQDLHEAAHLHCLLQALMGWPQPVYFSHALVANAQSQRLSKRDRAANLRHLRETGVSPGDIRALLDLPRQ